MIFVEKYNKTKNYYLNGMQITGIPYLIEKLEILDKPFSSPLQQSRNINQYKIL